MNKTREEAIKTLKENYCAMCAYGSQDYVERTYTSQAESEDKE